VTVVVLIGAGLLGGVGSVGRVLLDAAVSSRRSGRFPLGILVVNVSGSFALGVLVGASLGSDALRLLGGGLIGGYTTFSTWVFESHQRARGGARPLAAANIVVSLLAGLLAVWLGRELGMALGG
jgi:CrcB protein